jgi:hypothetical protein
VFRLESSRAITMTMTMTITLTIRLDALVVGVVVVQSTST